MRNGADGPLQVSDVVLSFDDGKTIDLTVINQDFHVFLTAHAKITNNGDDPIRLGSFKMTVPKKWMAFQTFVSPASNILIAPHSTFSMPMRLQLLAPAEKEFPFIWLAETTQFIDFTADYTVLQGYTMPTSMAINASISTDATMADVDTQSDSNDTSSETASETSALPESANPTPEAPSTPPRERKDVKMTAEFQFDLLPAAHLFSGSLNAYLPTVPIKTAVFGPGGYGKSCASGTVCPSSLGSEWVQIRNISDGRTHGSEDSEHLDFSLYNPAVKMFMVDTPGAEYLLDMRINGNGGTSIEGGALKNRTGTERMNDDFFVLFVQGALRPKVHQDESWYLRIDRSPHIRRLDSIGFFLDVSEVDYVRNSLLGQYRRLADLAAKHGVDKVYFVITRGPTSPITIDYLRTNEWKTLIAKAMGWTEEEAIQRILFNPNMCSAGYKKQFHDVLVAQQNLQFIYDLSIRTKTGWDWFWYRMDHFFKVLRNPTLLHAGWNQDVDFFVPTVFFIWIEFLTGAVLAIYWALSKINCAKNTAVAAADEVPHIPPPAAPLIDFPAPSNNGNALVAVQQASVSGPDRFQ